MKRYRKLVAGLLVGSMACGLLAGCGGGYAGGTANKSQEPAEQTEAPVQKEEDASVKTPGADSDDPVAALLEGKGDGLKIGLTVSDLTSTYIVAAAEYTQKLLEASGAAVTLVNCESNASTQASQIDDFISMGCDVIAIHAADSEALATSVDKAVEAGIPCVGFNKEISGGKLSFAVVSSDNVATGASAAQWLADKAKEEGVENPKVAVMQGTMTQSDAYLRQEGIEDVAKKEGLNLINEPCEWLSDKAESALNDVLTANPDLFGIITHCDSMDTGVISALRQADMAGKAGDENHIYWSGIDCDPVGVESLNTGLMDVCVEQSPLSLATVVAKGILEYVAKGEELGGEVIPMNTRVITGADTNDDSLWALYDTKSEQFWSGTEGIWNEFLN